MIRQYPWQLLIVLFFTALIIRLIFFYLFLLENPCIIAYDAGHYHQAALSLYNKQGFTCAGLPYFYRLPGYPFFLSIAYFFGNGAILSGILLQLVIASLIPVLIFFLVRIVYPSYVAVSWIVALFTVIHPGLLIFSGLLMTETLFVLLLMIAMLFLLIGLDEKSVKKLFFAGVFIGCAGLVRPIGFFILSLALFVLLLRGYRYKAAFLGLISGFSIIVGAWVLRNFVITGYLFLHTLSGPHMLNHFLVPLLMRAEHYSWAEVTQRVKQEQTRKIEETARLLQRDLIEIEQVFIAEKMTLHYIKKYPILALVLASKNCLKTSFSLYSSELLMIDDQGALPHYQEQRSLSDLVMRFLQPKVHNVLIIPFIYFEIFYFLILLVGFLGSLFLMKKYMCYALLSIGLVVIFVSLTFACGFARLRLPAEIFVIPWSVFFWYNSYFAIRNSKGK